MVTPLLAGTKIVHSWILEGESMKFKKILVINPASRASGATWFFPLAMS